MWRTAAASARGDAIAGAAGCLAHGDGRRRCASDLPDPRARGGAATHRHRALEPPGGARGRPSRPSWRPRALPVRAAASLEQARRDADIVSCATLSQDPLVRGAWLKPGRHMSTASARSGRRCARRTTNASAARRCSATRAAGRSRRGATWPADRVRPDHPRGRRADLFDIARGVHPGRTSEDESTLFKSVGDRPSRTWPRPCWLEPAGLRRGHSRRGSASARHRHGQTTVQKCK